MFVLRIILLTAMAISTIGAVAGSEKDKPQLVVLFSISGALVLLSFVV